MLLVRNPAGEIFLERRPPAGIWGGLWSLPEQDPGQDVAEWCRRRLGVLPLRVEKLPVRRHTFSHFHLDILPVRIELRAQPATLCDSTPATWCDPHRADTLGMAAPIAGILREVADVLQNPSGEST
jgi:A/G-specific adenine glycosylase